MTTQYNIYSYVKGVDDFGLPFSDTVQTVTLATNTAATITVPGTAAVGAIGPTVNKFIAKFSYTDAAVVWVTTNGTAAVPAGNTFAASFSELNPKGKYVRAGDVISCISPGTPSVSVSFYAIQEG